MGFFSCPKKSDNHKWTEEEWLSKPWTEKEKRINAEGFQVSDFGSFLSFRGFDWFCHTIFLLEIPS